MAQCPALSLDKAGGFEESGNVYTTGLSTGAPSLGVESARCQFTTTKPLEGMGAAGRGEQSPQGTRKQET